MTTLSAVQRRHRSAFLDKLSRGVYWLETVPRCPCGSERSTRVATRDRFDLPVGFVLCADCGLARTTPRLAADHLPSFYDRHYHGLHQGVDEPDPGTALFRVGQGRTIYVHLAAELPAGPLRVADIGCGTGQVLREFIAAANRSIEAQGCEYSAKFVAAGQAAGTDLRQGGPDVLDGQFDVLILSHVVEHFADLGASLAEVRRLTHPRSLLYVEVPGLLTIHDKPEYAYRFDRYLTLAHTYHFTLRTLTETMARAGFAPVHGDEVVRATFRPSNVTNEIGSRETAGEISAYLVWLRRSPRVRVRRAALAAHGVLSRGAIILRSVLGERTYARLRRRVQ